MFLDIYIFRLFGQMVSYIKDYLAKNLGNPTGFGGFIVEVSFVLYFYYQRRQI